MGHLLPFSARLEGVRPRWSPKKALQAEQAIREMLSQGSAPCGGGQPEPAGRVEPVRDGRATHAPRGFAPRW